MDGDDDSWEVQNRKKRGGGAGVAVNQNISKFFVTNIPQGCRPWDLANAFRGFGEIAGAFIAKKKDKEGRIFGFISFRGVRDQGELKHNLSNVKLGGNKLLVNVARFAKENGDVKPVASVGGGVRPKGTGQVKFQEGAPKSWGMKPVKEGVSFLDILTNRTRADSDDDVLVLDPAIFSLSGLAGRAVIGRTVGFHELRSLKSSLLLAGFVGVSIQYLGGLSVLLSFENGDLSNIFLQDKVTWSRWFSSVSPWRGQPLSYERLAWVIIHGVPPHLVSRKVFDSIGSKYGKVVQPSQFLETDGDISYDRLGILIDSGNRINGILNLSWQDKRYKVWVVEEIDQWVPDFLDDEEGSLAASSELGGSSTFPAAGESSVKEFEQFVESTKVEVEKRTVNLDCPKDMGVPMQNTSGGYVSKNLGDQSVGDVGQHIFVANCVQEGEKGKSDSFNFNIGRPNTAKPIKVKRAFLKNTNRPVNRNSEVGVVSEVSRPKKRTRSSLDGGCSSRSQVRAGGYDGDGPDKGFEQFHFDLNNKFPSEVNDSVEPIVNQVGEVESSVGEEGGVSPKEAGVSDSPEVDKEVSVTVGISCRIGIDVSGHQELIRKSINSGINAVQL
ncbi:uncharacterized protein LOC110893282 [Helianthus annuus]|uniref:uncharacterized protein LOC110893282 n=1 Tax=Helianthus annuus TaxID=4232 RepID=UPI000B905A1A|nr:uncharacterized protein LOC110893282 [Helianthus annuus]